MTCNSIKCFSYKGYTYCECCDNAYNHESFSGNPALDKLIASRKDRFIKRPTNTFGQFETPCSSVMAEFVRLADDTPVEDLEKLFFRIWKLRKPGLVLTLHGSVPLTKAQQKRCYNLIFGVFHKALAWIITDGQYGSVSEVMSMGMPGYAEAYGLKRLQVIGIVPWRRLPFQANLRSSNYMGSTQVEFPQKGNKSELHTPLAPYHTRYLFVDSGPKNDIHCIQIFRTMFEVWLTKLTMQSDKCNLSHNTPVCGILITGRPEDAQGVCEALRNNIPFVVVAALTKYTSWRTFISKLDNQFTLAAFAFYSIGVTLQVFLIEPTRRTFVSEQFSRICLVFAACLPFQKLLQLLSINCYIGPKLQMIRKMVVRDLLPFLTIVLMFWSMYTIFFSAIILRPSSSTDTYGAISRLFRIMRAGFFQMFGEFNLEELLEHYEKSFHNSPARARQLINWEKLNAFIVTGAQEVDDDTGVKSRKDECSLRTAARTNHDKHWQILRRLRPTDQNINGMKKSVLEQKIESIDSALENMMTFVSIHCILTS
ncbi:unnamed protein product [Hymenolepis diminuta]|uniref:TRPM SLOG domain-containing protein n=1 Tax=Hymenolepis diminuta TaxID=6216 RepID=A0A564Z1A7_HYMDI|nr:unnamed protein product [Hymenolepis diminuta]